MAYGHDDSTINIILVLLLLLLFIYLLLLLLLLSWSSLFADGLINKCRS